MDWGKKSTSTAHVLKIGASYPWFGEGGCIFVTDCVPFFQLVGNGGTALYAWNTPPELLLNVSYTSVCHANSDLIVCFKL